MEKNYTAVEELIGLLPQRTKKYLKDVLLYVEDMGYDLENPCFTKLIYLGIEWYGDDCIFGYRLVADDGKNLLIPILEADIPPDKKEWLKEIYITKIILEGLLVRK